jgi:hypothetical protein
MTRLIFGSLPDHLQVVEDGYEFFAKRHLVTLFSAPNYCGEFDNAGAMMSVDETLLCSFQVGFQSILPTSRSDLFLFSFRFWNPLRRRLNILTVRWTWDDKLHHLVNRRKREDRMDWREWSDSSSSVCSRQILWHTHVDELFGPVLPRLWPLTN